VSAGRVKTAVQNLSFLLIMAKPLERPKTGG
jgi:hypothetical protein